ncbi:hypothetical protein IMSAGC022_00042 [Alistipes sp.]|nr:hypothetical protein IMSAGC022_00042 [Alistipes sp.]
MALMLTIMAWNLTYIPARKKRELFFCLPLPYIKSKNDTP